MDIISIPSVINSITRGKIDSLEICKLQLCKDNKVFYTNDRRLRDSRPISS